MRTPNASADLARACERALARAARAAGAGTRQQVRAAARRFVRRHRRDEAALRRSLRAALASATLAAALLGLSPGSARAAAPWLETLSPNPLGAFDVGSGSAPAAADRDGDLDLVTGQLFGAFLAFEDTGDATSPAWTALAGDDNPFDGFDVGNEAVPVVADLDADGALDFVAGNDDGDLRVYSLPEPGGPGLWTAALLLLRGLAQKAAPRRGRRRPHGVRSDRGAGRERGRT